MLTPISTLSYCTRLLGGPQIELALTPAMWPKYKKDSLFVASDNGVQLFIGKTY